MKVLTIKSVEQVSQETQLDIHYAFRMEHHTDYVFRDDKASSYAATISLDESGEIKVEDVIIRNSVSFPDMTFIINVVDMEKNLAERSTVKNGEVVEKKQGSWMWD